MPEYTFYNVQVTIAASDAKRAYEVLCDALATAGDRLEFETDTWTTPHDEKVHSTKELFD